MRWLGISTLVILLGTIIVMLSLNGSSSDSRSTTKVEVDRQLISFDLAKSYAREVRELISIDSEESYQQARNKFRRTLSSTVYQEYFSSPKYIGGDKKFTLVEESVTGDIQGRNSYIFKVVYRMEGIESSPNLTLLVYVDNNQITRIKSLG